MPKSSGKILKALFYHYSCFLLILSNDITVWVHAWSSEYSPNSDQIILLGSVLHNQERFGKQKHENEVTWLSSSSFVLNYLNLVLGGNSLPSTRSPNFSVFRFVYLFILKMYYLTEKDGIVNLWDYKRSFNVLWTVTNPCIKIPWVQDLYKAFSKQNLSLHKYLMKENLEPSI